MQLESCPVPRKTLLTEIIQSLVLCRLRTGPWIAGGAARAVYEGVEGRPGGDIDIFSKDSESVREVVRHLRQVTRVTKESKTKTGSYNLLSSLALYGRTETARLQVVGSWHSPTLEELFKTFDFTICQFATDGRTIVYTTAAKADHEQRALRLQPEWVGRTRPTRIIKYLNQGFTPYEPMLKQLYRIDKRLGLGADITFDDAY